MGSDIIRTLSLAGNKACAQLKHNMHVEAKNKGMPGQDIPLSDLDKIVMLFDCFCQFKYEGIFQGRRFQSLESP